MEQGSRKKIYKFTWIPILPRSSYSNLQFYNTKTIPILLNDTYQTRAVVLLTIFFTTLSILILSTSISYWYSVIHSGLNFILRLLFWRNNIFAFSNLVLLKNNTPTRAVSTSNFTVLFDYRENEGNFTSIWMLHQWNTRINIPESSAPSHVS